MRHLSFPLSIILALALFFACSDPALIGSELLEEDRANLQFTDEIDINAKTVIGDAVQTYSPFISLQLPSLLFGNFEDPLLGTTEASIYSQVSLGFQEPPATSISDFDSIVLSLAYDTLQDYGDLNQSFGMEVFLLEDDLSNLDDYFSNQTFQFGAEPIGTIEFIPNFQDSLSIIDYTASDSAGVNVNLAPHIRIHLSGEFTQMIGQDTTILQNDTTFQNFFKGIYIRPTQGASNSGMLSFDFANPASGISLYHGVGRGAARMTTSEFKLDFNPSNARFANLKHDYDNSFSDPFLTSESDSLLFLQGMAGLNMEMSFGDLSGLENVVINKAELELTVANLEESDTALFPLVPQLIVSSIDNSNEKEIILDVRSALFAENPINTDLFGGIPVIEEQDGTLVTKYRLNLSGYFQKIIDGEAVNSFTISNGVEQSDRYFQLPPKPINASKTIFYGPNHPRFPLKLNLVYTKL